MSEQSIGPKYAHWAAYAVYQQRKAYGALECDAQDAAEETYDFYIANPPPSEQVEGVKYDSGKQDMTAIAYFPNALTAFAKVLDYGAKKYPSRDNWRKVPNLVPRYLAALVRHVFARIRGEILDPESGLPHLACAMCCIAFILEVEENK
jgi:hypothetical protein